MSNRWARRGAVALLLIVASTAFFYRLGAVPLFDDPNEAEYAEVAREMIDTGNWISPQLNYVLFLNKPPLEYWMIGVSDRLFGINELAARIPSALAGVVIIALLMRLGTVLFDFETGMLAGMVLLGMGGFFVETHLVRPDLILTASIVGSLLALSRLLTSPSRFQKGEPKKISGSALLGMQIALAVGLMTKGMLALIFPAMVCVIVMASERRFALLPQLLRPRAWFLLLVLFAPWHVVVALQHPGFVWDYVVNQHLLFFFDRKFPRDSVPVSLGIFWSAFVLRLFPWSIFAPLAVFTAGQRVPRGRDALGDRFVLAWAAAVLVFFSLSPSRMEHYSIPALPALALLIAKLFRDYANANSDRVTLHVVLFAAGVLLTPLIGPRLIASQEWLAPLTELPGVARSVSGVLVVGGMLAAVAALCDRRWWVAPAIAASVIATVPWFHQGLMLVARVNSSAPMAAAVRAVWHPSDRLVFEAPIEYQNCAAFNFYLQRKMDLIPPADFVAPPYLAPHIDALFIRRADLDELWRSARVFLITDPLAPRPELNGSVPHPYYVVSRDNDRWAVANAPLN